MPAGHLHRREAELAGRQAPIDPVRPRGHHRGGHRHHHRLRRSPEHSRRRWIVLLFIPPVALLATILTPASTAIAPAASTAIKGVYFPAVAEGSGGPLAVATAAAARGRPLEAVMLPAVRAATVPPIRGCAPTGHPSSPTTTAAAGRATLESWGTPASGTTAHWLGIRAGPPALPAFARLLPPAKKIPYIDA